MEIENGNCFYNHVGQLCLKTNKTIEDTIMAVRISDGQSCTYRKDSVFEMANAIVVENPKKR